MGFSLGILAVLAAGFGGCENPWMKEAVAPLYKNKDGGENNSGGGSGVPVPTLHSIGEVTAYLAAATVIPVPLAVALNLSGSEWLDLLGAINGAGKTVQLDLSACTPSGSSGCLYTSGGDVIFDPDSSDSDSGRIAAKGLITSLVLPATAEIIPAGAYANPTFKHFAFTSIKGENVQEIRDYAFFGLTFLTSADFPAAEEIGLSVFHDCNNLAEVSLLKAETIAASAFRNCASLTSMDLPEATLINGSFYGCTLLESLNLPKVENIGTNSFRDCAALTTLNLGKATAPVLGTSVFRDTGTGTLTIHVPAGAVGNYMGAWSVSASTVPSGNQGVYGLSHKQIEITDL
ncbi:MAG: leucine-rich repeat domain-containing protein [Treponema sp.]|nr:leucine-rich repeat domain-containing protein [Treponema sp.]